MKYDPIDEALEEEGLLDEEAEWHELVRRQKAGECSCDLLSPLGHVTCTYCSNPTNFEDDFGTAGL